jgi:hypothetical protein
MWRNSPELRFSIRSHDNPNPTAQIVFIRLEPCLARIIRNVLPALHQLIHIPNDVIETLNLPKVAISPQNLIDPPSGELLPR